MTQLGKEESKKAKTRLERMILENAFYNGPMELHGRLRPQRTCIASRRVGISTRLSTTTSCGSEQRNICKTLRLQKVWPWRNQLNDNDAMNIESFINESCYPFRKWAKSAWEAYLHKQATWQGCTSSRLQALMATREDLRDTLMRPSQSTSTVRKRSRSYRRSTISWSY